ncbi:unnamed protein product [Camellia sinensis]
MDKATAAQSTQPKAEAAAREAEEKAKAAEAKYAKAEVEAKITENKSKLAEMLEAKEAEVKAADEKASTKGQADVRDQYKKQVNLACNKGYFLGWMAMLKKLFVLEDSPLRDITQFEVPFPLSPDNSKTEAEEEDFEAEDIVEAEVRYWSQVPDLE